jgi:hypothetical protein
LTSPRTLRWSTRTNPFASTRATANGCSIIATERSIRRSTGVRQSAGCCVTPAITGHKEALTWYGKGRQPNEPTCGDRVSDPHRIRLG